MSTSQIVLAILTLIFGTGGGGLFVLLNKERKDRKAEPALAEKQDLENKEAAARISGLLREETAASMDSFRDLLAEARSEAAEAKKVGQEARAEAKQLRAELELERSSQTRFRARVEHLLSENGVSIPDWWHQSGLD